MYHVDLMPTVNLTNMRPGVAALLASPRGRTTNVFHSVMDSFVVLERSVLFPTMDQRASASKGSWVILSRVANVFPMFVLQMYHVSSRVSVSVAGVNEDVRALSVESVLRATLRPTSVFVILTSLEIRTSSVCHQ